jgi:MFS family permease
MLGLATSIFHPVGNALISKGCERRGRALGINGIAGSIGTALGPMVAGGIADWSSWRWLFVGLAVPSAVLAVGLLFTDLGPAASPASHPPAPAAGRESPQDGRGRNGIVLLFVLLLVAMVCGGFYFKLATTALPYQLSEHGVLSERMGPGALKAGLALSFGAIGQFLAGWLCDRRAETWLYVANLGLLFPCFYLLSTLQGQTALWPTAAAASILMFGVQPIENSALARFTPPRWRGRVYGVKFILVFGLGGFGSWLATGILKTSGAPAVFEVSAVLALAAFALALVAAAVSRKTADF